MNVSAAENSTKGTNGGKDVDSLWWAVMGAMQGFGGGKDWGKFVTQSYNPGGGVLMKIAQE